MAAPDCILQDRGPCLRILRTHRALVQLLPLWIVDADLPSYLCARTAIAGSYAARELSVEHAVSRRRFGRVVQAGEIDFSLRSSSALRALAAGNAVDASECRGSRLCGDFALLVAGYISFYARYTYWAGDFSWGDRYVSTAVQMVALLSLRCF